MTLPPIDNANSTSLECPLNFFSLDVALEGARLRLIVIFFRAFVLIVWGLWLTRRNIFLRYLNDAVWFYLPLSLFMNWAFDRPSIGILWRRPFSMHALTGHFNHHFSIPRWAHPSGQNMTFFLISSLLSRPSCLVCLVGLLVWFASLGR